MQVIAHTGAQELADILEQSTILNISDHGGMRLYTINHAGSDILIFHGPDEAVWSVYEHSVFDAECGGSIHDQARAINAEAGRAPGVGDISRDDLGG